jgi:hypothetical protein
MLDRALRRSATVVARGVRVDGEAMSDVERLRALAWGEDGDVRHALRSAAAEITALRAENDQLRRTNAVYADAEARAEAAEADAARLRANGRFIMSKLCGSCLVALDAAMSEQKGKA